MDNQLIKRPLFFKFKTMISNLFDVMDHIKDCFIAVLSYPIDKKKRNKPYKLKMGYSGKFFVVNTRKRSPIAYSL